MRNRNSRVIMANGSKPDYILPKLKSPAFIGYLVIQGLAAYFELGVIIFVCAILVFIIRNTGTEEPKGTITQAGKLSV